MLLDDVMSELDRDRRARLVGLLRGRGQSVITTTDLDHVPGAEQADVTRLRGRGRHRAERRGGGMSRRAPAPARQRARAACRQSLAPATLLAAVQRAWPEAAGEAIAREAAPVAERGGVVTVACSASVWAQELDLMAPLLIEKLNAAVAPARSDGCAA